MAGCRILQDQRKLTKEMVKNKNLIGTLLLILAVLINSCSNGQSQDRDVKTNLSANEFAEKITQIPEATLIDVRTPGEFSKGRLKNAVNIDWNGNSFDNHVALLDKKQPLMIYCLSGSRSASAAGKLRSMGFAEVFELNGGIMKWNAAGLPLSGSKNKNKGMTVPEFEKLLETEKLVLVDFYADWCLPCKKMKPYLDEISREMADDVEVVRINVDENSGLYKELKIDAIPVLQIYKGKKLAWSNQGFISKEKVVEQLQ
jgi:thioredoxin 1